MHVTLLVMWVLAFTDPLGTVCYSELNGLRQFLGLKLRVNWWKKYLIDYTILKHRVSDEYTHILLSIINAFQELSELL